MKRGEIDIATILSLLIIGIIGIVFLGLFDVDVPFLKDADVCNTINKVKGLSFMPGFVQELKQCGGAILILEKREIAKDKFETDEEFKRFVENTIAEVSNACQTYTNGSCSKIIINTKNLESVQNVLKDNVVSYFDLNNYSINLSMGDIDLVPNMKKTIDISKSLTGVVVE